MRPALPIAFLGYQVSGYLSEYLTLKLGQTAIVPDMDITKLG